MKFLDTDSRREKKREKIGRLVKDFVALFSPQETEIIVMTDYLTKAFYIEVHIQANKIVELATIDIPLDPEEQSEYRANREVVEDHVAFIKMKEDARAGRTFSNIVTEYRVDFEEETPLKIIGGQHRFIAIEEAFKDDSVNKYHGVKIYFDLDNNQRLDVQLISNTNIAVASDLLDRMFETIKGPELRDWCQSVGLLEKEQDFADKKSRTSQITVRLARTFFLSYFAGKENKKANYEKISPSPLIARTGKIDEDWEKLRASSDDIWNDQKLMEAGKKFAELHLKQREYFEGKKRGSLEYASKTLNYSIVSAWAYVAGLLEDNTTRLHRHYNLSNSTTNDPLNAPALAKGRHKTDPENYRGLGTRTDMKERGRLAELFYLQAEKGDGLNKNLVDLAIKKYQAKLAMIEVLEAEKKVG